MAQRKHITELALNLFSDGVLVVHPKDIARIDGVGQEMVNLASQCHIYLIVTHLRPSFVPGSVEVGDGKTTGKLAYVRDGVRMETDFAFAGEAVADRIEISDYPHRMLSLIRNGERFFSIPAHHASLASDRLGDPSLRDLCVVYVGMSYGDGGRSAKDRLLSHSTLQQVLADLTAESPDSEALVIMVQYVEPQAMITFDGHDKSLREENDRNVIGDLQRVQKSITEELQIRLIEAALIRYFRPRYNDKYKHHFPNPTQKILEEVYAIDFGALVVEIDTEEINSRLFSPTRNPGYHHVASFDLHDPAIRRSFFNLMDNDGGPDAGTFSGPVF